jgi:hypothetical protein
MKAYCILVLLLLSQAAPAQQPFVQILGIAQDGGYPHMGCTKNCCTRAWEAASARRFVVSLAIADPLTKKWWLMEATPDIKEQLQYFKTLTHGNYPYLPEGIFITHAHIGHYTGLMEFGREVMSTKQLPVYVLPGMKTFLETNGPWSQLVQLKNIVIHPLTKDSVTSLNERIQIEPFTVPHRDEYSETAGFKLMAGKRKFLFIPDINKWKNNIVEQVEQVDYALLDATFFDATELPGRNIQEVPHPLVTETMGLFQNTGVRVKAKLVFIHFNHTNPLLWDESIKTTVNKAGFHIAEQGQVLQ